MTRTNCPRGRDSTLIQPGKTRQETPHACATENRNTWAARMTRAARRIRGPDAPDRHLLVGMGAAVCERSQSGSDEAEAGGARAVLGTSGLVWRRGRRRSRWWRVKATRT